MVHREALAERAALPALRIDGRSVGRGAQDHALPLPGESLLAAFQRPYGNCHGQFLHRLSEMGYRALPVRHGFEGRIQYEVAPGSWHHAKSAWFMAHRIREVWAEGKGDFSGPVEIDETYIGGKERNKDARKKLRAGQGGSASNHQSVR